MPFTFAHPGFVIPIKKWKPQLFSATGLFFGSVTPDLDIILRLTNQRFHIFQYDLFCVFVYIFPLSLFFGIYFHLFMRNVLIDHLPSPIQEKFIAYKDYDYLAFLRKNFLRVCFSIIFAIYLHLFLDLVSHWNANSFQIYGGHTFHSYTISMIYYYGAIYLPPLIFTFAGFYLIARATGLNAGKIRQSVAAMWLEKEKWGFYFVFLIVALFITVLKFMIGAFEYKFFIDHLVINLTNGCIVSVAVTPALYYIRNKIKQVN